jgi:hypothetical protein
MGGAMDFLSLFSGGQRGWLEAAMVASFFWIAVARPERIGNIMRFRIACILFALSILTPALVNLYLVTSGSNPFGRMAGGGGDPGAGIYLQIATPALLMFSFLLGIDSVMPRKPTPERRPPAPPTTPLSTS